MVDRPTICVTEHIHPDAMARLAEIGNVIGPGPEADDWPARAEAVIVRSAPVSQEQLQRATRLRVIGKHGAGTDTIDVQAANAAGIPVLTAAGTNAESVADLAICLALNLLRAPDLHDAALRGGRMLAPRQRIGFELSELQAGILGMGAIGRAVAQRLVHGFGASVLAYDPMLPASDWPERVERAETVDDVLSRSGILFLHLPLLPETTHVLNERAFALMPRGSFVVNCARGGIVDEAALAEAIADGHIAGAASDVFEAEPPDPQHALFSAGRFIGTPHIGGSTEAGLKRTGMLIAERVISELKKPR